MEKPRYQSSASEPRECFASKTSSRAEAVFTLSLCADADPRRRYDHDKFFFFSCMQRAHCCLSTHVHRLFSSFIYSEDFAPRYRAFNKRNSSLRMAEGPSLQIKTQSINTLPLGNWRPTNLYLKGICVICKAALGLCVRMIHSPECGAGLLRQARSRCGRRLKGQSVSIKIDLFGQNERTRSVGVLESMCSLSRCNPRRAMCELCVF